MLHRKSPRAQPGNPPRRPVAEVAPGVFFVEGPASNWIIVRDETGFILIDSGYPADTPLVLESIRELGLEPAEAKAILITHGHVDHTGSADLFSRLYGTPVLCSPEELAHVQGKEKHQVTLGQVLARSWRPRIARWMIHAITAGALSAEPATRAQSWTAEQLRSLPGRPVAVSVPGHTAGSVALVLPDADAIATGDALVTGHPISAVTGPQLLDPMFHSHPGDVPASLEGTAGIEASVILPGHGPALQMPLAQAVAAARR